MGEKIISWLKAKANGWIYMGGAVLFAGAVFLSMMGDKGAFFLAGVGACLLTQSILGACIAVLKGETDAGE